MERRSKEFDFALHVLYDWSITKGKDGVIMGTEAERQDTRKAMAFDLIQIIRENQQQTNYTAEEVEKLIVTYVRTANEK